MKNRNSISLMVFMNKIGKKRFFVTGGAGFIGSNMVERLISEGAEVLVYDNLSSGRMEFIEEFERQGKLEFVKGDLLDKELLEDTMKSGRFDAVIHLAANPDVRRGAVETDLDLKQGTIVTYNVMEAARKSDIKDILFASSSVVYGVAKIKPTPEDYGPLAPISLYGASKLASEGLITAFSHLFGMRYFIYRFANVVGKNATHGVILDFANKLRNNGRELEVLGNGKQKKSYIEVGDCVDGMLYVYDKSQAEDNIYNLTTDDQSSVSDIAEIVISKFSPGTRIRYTGTEQGWPGDIANTFLSNKKITEIGWKPKHKSIDAVKLTVDYVYETLTGK